MLDNTAREPVGKLVQNIRTQQQMSISTLARLTGLSANTIRWIERGVTQPKPESLKALGLALGVNYEELLLRAGYIDTVALTDEEKDVLRLYHSLSPEGKEMLLAVLGVIKQMLEGRQPAQTKGEPAP